MAELEAELARALDGTPNQSLREKTLQNLRRGAGGEAFVLEQEMHQNEAERQAYAKPLWHPRPAADPHEPPSW